MGPLNILVIEDNPADVRLTQEAFRDAKVKNHLYVVGDGVEAMAFLRKQGAFRSVPTPDLIILDLNLPRKDGKEVLSEIKSNPDLKDIPIIHLTNFHAKKDLLRQLWGAGTWEEFRNSVCYLIERALLGRPFNDKDLLIRALTRNALLNEPIPFEELKIIGSQDGLDTFGDKILDFIIFDHFNSRIRRYTPEEFDDLRKRYGNNELLHRFAKEKIKLQDFVLWGPDERRGDAPVWEKHGTTVLADCFEALIGALYIDKNIEGVKRFVEKINFFDGMKKYLDNT